MSAGREESRLRTGLPMFSAHFSPQSSGNNLHEHMFKFTLTHEEHQVWTQRTKQHSQPWPRPAGTAAPFQEKKKVQVKLQKLNNTAPLTHRNKSKEYFSRGLIKCGYEGSIPWCRSVVESEQLLKLWSSFEKPDHFWSAVEIIMRTTLIADDKSQSQRRIWLVQGCQGSSWRNKAAFCFCSKAFCLRFIEKKKKITLILR